MQKILLDGWIDVAVLQNLFGIGPDAEIGHSAGGNVRPAMGYTLRDYRNVAHGNFAGDIVAYNLTTAGRAIENLGDFAVRTGTHAIHDLAAGNQGARTGDHDIGLVGIVMRNAARGWRLGAGRKRLDAARNSIGRPLRRSASWARATGRAALDHGDGELIGAEIHHF